MDRRIKWNDGMVRQVFALRAEEHSMASIATVMGTSTSMVSRLLGREAHAKVSVQQSVLDKIASVEWPTGGGRVKGSKNKRPRPDKGTKVPADMSPAMPQAMKKADPQYGGTTSGMNRRVRNLKGMAANTANMLPSLKERVKDPRPGVSLDDLGLEPLPDDITLQLGVELAPLLTRADAMAHVLTLIQMGNMARADLAAAREDILVMERTCKTTEDEAFAYIQALSQKGFSASFLNDFLTECGLCGDGLLASK